MHPKMLVVLIIMFFATAGQLFGITLSDNGKTNYTIVISNTASPSERHGAEELQYFFQMITGAYLPILKDNDVITGPVILVGNSSVLQKIDPSLDLQPLGDEGFIMKTVGQNLILAGGKLRGSMYAVYTFLEKLGCRWYSAEVSKIPSIATVTIEAINETQKPAFAYREPFWFDAFDVDLAARNKNNGSHTRVDDERGGKYKYWGGHNFHFLVPPDQYFNDHPEYYSYINGKRIWEYAQICLTNPELMKLTTKNVLQVIDKDPGNDVYEISQMDWANWCTCELCKALDEREESHAATAVNFVNQIADRVKPYYPDKLIGTFAYRYTEKAPKSIQARDNVCIRLCNIIGCDAHPLTECPQNLNWFTQNMSKWNKLAKKIIIWDYVTNFSHYLMPFPNWYATWKDIQFFKQNNVIGIFEEGAFQSEGSSFEELEAYLQAKNLWNPDLDYRVVLDDFLQGYFHNAAPAIRKYMDHLQSQVSDRGLHFNLYSPPTIELFSPENVANCERYLDEAERLAQGDPEAAYRIEELRLGIRYVKLAQPVEHVLDGNLYKIAASAPSYANLRELDEFIRDCRKHNVTYLREGGVLEQSFRILRANVSNHQVITLGNTQLQIDIIPRLSGRMHRIVDKKTNRNYLRLPAKSENIGGTEPFTYSIEKNSQGQRITMEGGTSTRKTTRSIFVPADKKEIQITSTLESLNPAESRGSRESRGDRESRPVRVSQGLDLLLGKWEDVRAGVRSEKQEFNWKQLVKEKDELRQSISISTFFNQREIKGGAWAVINEKENTGIMNVFNPDEVEMCAVSSDTTTGGIRMSMSGIQQVMKPGDKLTISCTIIPIDDVQSTIKTGRR